MLEECLSPGKSPSEEKKEQHLQCQLFPQERHFVLLRCLSDTYDRHEETAAEI